MTTLQVVALPEHFAGRGIDACRTVAAEVGVEATGLYCRGGRGVAIHVVPERLRRIAVEEFLVVDDLAGGRVDAHVRKVVTIFRGGCEPDFSVQDDRSGPTEAVDGCFPGDVLRLAPSGR